MVTPPGSTAIGARPTHPGRILRRELDAKEMTQAELAARMNRPPQVISDIVTGKKGVTAETAAGLEIVLGMPAHIWLNLQSNFELTRRRLEERSHWEELASEYQKTLSDIGLSELLKRGWLEKHDSSGEQCRELLAFFGAQSFEAVQHTAAGAAFRVTPGAKLEPWRLAAWMRRGENIVSQRPRLPDFDPDGFRAALASIRSLTLSDSPWPELRNHCAAVGVHVVVVPHLPKSGASGATYWTRKHAPVILLSLLGKRADKLWFTFYHEAAHVLEGHRKDAHIDLDQMPREDEIEQAANRFAADILIPPTPLETFVGECRFDDESITEFAASIDIHPGIVVGRLQNDGLLDPSWLNHLRVSLDESMFTD